MSLWQAAATVAIVAGVCACAAPALAIERGTTEDGWPYLAGGYGVEERAELERAAKAMRLRLTTAAQGSGAYLAGVRIRIADATGRSVFDREIDGPLLLIDLAPGRYAVRGSLAGETVAKQIAIGAADRRQLHLYFRVAVEVLPDDAPERR